MIAARYGPLLPGERVTVARAAGYETSSMIIDGFDSVLCTGQRVAV